MNEITIGDVVEFDVVHIKRTNKYCAAKIRIVEKNRNPVTPSRIRTKSRNHPSISNYAEYMIHDISENNRQKYNSFSKNNDPQFNSSSGSFFERQKSRNKKDSFS